MRPHPTSLQLSILLAVSLLVLPVLSTPLLAQAKQVRDRPEPSSMGAIFMGLTELPEWMIRGGAELPPPVSLAPPISLAPLGIGQGDINVTPGVPRFQSETSIAVNGDSIVVGFNDADGFSNPAGVSVSGYAYSHDGGATFTYGGQLPVLGGGDAVRGDPDVKVWVDPATGKATFVYSSIYLTTGGLFSLCVHVSTDGGVTWSGPREATSVSHPSDFADKEFIDVDPETGRILMTWTSFGATLQMRRTYSDDFGLTWAPALTFSARPEDGQGSCPRFDPASNRAYVVWRSFASPSSISFVRSLDNGATWGAPTNIISGVSTPLPPFGSDRINGFPALAVGPVTGDLHLIYASRQTADFGDVLYAVSRDFGSTWTTPTFLNASPGSDRVQFFPWISAQDNGAGVEWVDAVWLDQSSGTAGSDLTNLMHAHSLDGGVSWTAPANLLTKPFHAEYGQDTGQPNMGDYNQCASQNGRMFTSYARTGVADYATRAPDTYVASSRTPEPAAPLRLVGLSVTSDLGCNPDGLIVANEAFEFTLTLHNDGPGSITNLTGTVATTTPDVVLTSPGVTLAGPCPALSDCTTLPLSAVTRPGYACGAPIELVLTATSDQGPVVLEFAIPTGVIQTSTTLIAESFDGVGSGLPGGWTHVQITGASNPWAVSSAFSVSGPNAVFCADLPSVNRSRLESPLVSVPVTADRVEVTFEVTYSNEEVGDGRQGWDGALLKLEVNGFDVLAGAFPTLFDGQYRMLLVRGSGSSANPLQDLSAWSGNTLPTFEPIKIEYPGLAGTSLRLAWEMGSDVSVGDVGIYVDDVRVRALDLGCATCTQAPGLAVDPPAVVLSPAMIGATACSTVTIHNTGDGILNIASVTGCNAGDFSLDLTGMIDFVLPGDSTSFVVCVTPTGPGASACSVVVMTDAGNDTIPVSSQVATAAGDGGGLPRALTIEPVLPNPFNPQARIRFALPRAGRVWVTVYDISGRRVRTLLDGTPQEAGAHSLVWNGTDDRGRGTASGVYWIRVRTETESKVTKAVLLK